MTSSFLSLLACAVAAASAAAPVDLFNLHLHLAPPGPAKPSQCEQCHTGPCARCQTCVDTHDEDCASCWEPQPDFSSSSFSSASAPCLSTTLDGTGCRGCFVPDSPPIIIVPGLTSSDLLSKQHDVPQCAKNAPHNIWPINATQLESIPALACFFQQTKINYDNASKTFTQPTGIDTGVIDFGGLGGFNLGGGINNTYGPYGYREHVNLFGAPFDWRYSSEGLADYYSALKALVETVYGNKQEKVTLRCLSYGPQVALGFLHRMTQGWKDKYIAWYIADSPVFSGTTLLIEALTAGVNFYGSPKVVEAIEVLVGWSFPAFLWVLPRNGPDQFTYGKEEVLAYTPGRNYTAWDFADMISDLGHDDRRVEFEYINQGDLGVTGFAAPGVDTFVNYGYNLTTPGAYHFLKDFAHFSKPNITLKENATETGDYVVPLRSGLRATVWWAEQMALGKKLVVKGYDSLFHAACVVGSQGGPGGAGDAGSLCLRESMNLLLNHASPSAGRCGLSRAAADADCGASGCVDDLDCAKRRKGATAHAEEEEAMCFTGLTNSACSHARCGHTREEAEGDCTSLPCVDSAGQGRADDICGLVGQTCFAGLATPNCNGLQE